MTYLYLSKIEDNYFIMNSSEIHSFKEPSCNYGLSCKLDLSYDELTSKAGGLYGKVVDQALELHTLLKGCKAFKQEETNIKFNGMLNQYLVSLDQIELASFDIQVKEAEHYLSCKGKYDSVNLKSLATAQSISLEELVSNILRKAQEHNSKLINFKCLKDFIESKLETINSLEGFEAFDIENEIAKYNNHEDVKQTSEHPADQLLILSPNESPSIYETVIIPSDTKEDLNIKISDLDLTNDLDKLQVKKSLEKVSKITRRRNAQ